MGFTIGLVISVKRNARSTIGNSKIDERKLCPSDPIPQLRTTLLEYKLLQRNWYHYSDIKRLGNIKI